MSSLARVPIQSTAGAVPIRNEKGEISMEKVKVARYVSGKRPDFAPQSSDEEEEDIEVQIQQRHQRQAAPRDDTGDAKAYAHDRRLRRLKERQKEEADDEEEDDRQARVARHRRLHEPEVLDASSGEENSGSGGEEVTSRVRRMRQEEEMEESEEEEELSEDEIERRRTLLREKVAVRADEEIMDVQEEKEGSAEESSEYESEYESEEEETGPRLKPVFVRKKDRITIQEKEKEERRQQELQHEAKRMIEERRRTTVKLVAESLTKEMEEEKKVDDLLDTVITDDENDEEEYEAWKVRELKRMKRDRDERDQREKEKLETEKLRNMTEEERRKYAKENPKLVINQRDKKGKYKFLQKYYHRGAFYMDKEDQVFGRDYAEPTLEDHFDKTVLPKVMQVKNFGRSGRTKYTHLVDQDTTQYDSPWAAETAMASKFSNLKGGGMKQIFEKPSVKKKK